MSTAMMSRCYHELEQLETFEDRFDYLVLGGFVGKATFGFDRYLNQQFYQSRAWRRVRDEVILRDHGCDLGVIGYDIHTDLLVHHMNPIGVDDLIHGAEWVVDPEYLITTTKNTHNAIHYGDRTLIPRGPIERRAGDTRLW